MRYLFPKITRPTTLDAQKVVIVLEAKEFDAEVPGSRASFIEALDIYQAVETYLRLLPEETVRELVLEVYEKNAARGYYK